MSKERLFSLGTYSPSNGTPPNLLVYIVSVSFTMRKRMDSSRFEKLFMFENVGKSSHSSGLWSDLFTATSNFPPKLKSLLKRYRRDYGELDETVEADPHRGLGKAFCFGKIKMRQNKINKWRLSTSLHLVKILLMLNGLILS